LWSNRTGIIFGSFIFVASFVKPKYWFVFSLFMVAMMLSVFAFYATDLSGYLPSRLAEEGLESLRWLMQLEALDALTSLQYPFGGFYTPTMGFIPWLHNVVLDVYRVIGVLPAVFLTISMLYGGYRNLKSDLQWFRRTLAWICGVFIAMSSVMFEGHPFEFIYFFLIIFNFYFIPADMPKVRREIEPFLYDVA